MKRGAPGRIRIRDPLLRAFAWVSQLVDDLSYQADLTGGQPGNEPAFMLAYEAARSRVGTQLSRFDIMVSEHD
jgi:hypothetical protein